MKTLDLAVVIVTGLLLFSTVVCGLWLRYSGEDITDSSRVFHMVSGLLTAVFAIVMGILLLRR
jgi:hypothetical protein